jgi:hypothetical protein
MDPLKIDSQGQLKLPAELSRQLGSNSLAVLSSSARHLLLGRSDDDVPVSLTGMLGDIVLPDLLSFFNMFRKTGILNFELDGGEKALFFQKGEVVFATSTFADEELGEILFALGKVERSALQHARQIAAGRAPLGKVLVERGAVTAQDLWLAARNQVEGIVYNLFTFEQGSFSFQPKTLAQEKIVRLSMSTQNLIMEGLRRQDEHSLFMRKIISLDYFPVDTDKQVTELSPGEDKFLACARPGRLNARDLFRRVGLHEFDGMRTLYRLLEKGGLKMEEGPSSEIGGDLGQILKIYNSVLRAIYARVSQVSPGFAEEIKSFLRDLPQPFSFVLRDVGLLEDGTLDGHRVVANLEGLEEGDKKKLLADALSEMVFMESMAVRRELEAAQAQPLIARVQEITSRVKRLIGRNE